MPPLIFDATAKVQPEVDPKMIVLIRRVRVRPTLIFQGRVEGDMVAVKTSAPGPPHGSTALLRGPMQPAAPAPTPNNDSLAQRVRTLMRKLWPRGA